ncbi:hypothetical protein G9A89_001113 [Geosiphon pyriformis]|nr:hypothetical protein G9A89_001113 [Geosiphon pyriformis]
MLLMLDRAQFESLRLQDNNFAVTRNYSTMIKFKQLTFKTIRKRNIAEIFGLQPEYDDTISFPASGQLLPLHTNPNFTAEDSYFSFGVGSYSHRVEKQKRGVMDKYFDYQVKEIVKKFEQIPLVGNKRHDYDLGDAENFQQKETYEDRMNQLEKRHDDLEEFLSSYFLDITHLMRKRSCDDEIN